MPQRRSRDGRATSTRASGARRGCYRGREGGRAQRGRGRRVLSGARGRTGPVAAWRTEWVPAGIAVATGARVVGFGVPAAVHLAELDVGPVRHVHGPLAT